MKTVAKIIPRSVYGAFPFVLGIMLVFVAVLPVRLPLLGTNIGPFIILTVIFHSAVKYPSLLPSIGVFILRDGYDILSSVTLGYWALIFLCAHMLSSNQKYLLGKEKLLMSWLAFLVIAGLTGLLSWGLGSIFYGQLASFKGIFSSVLTAFIFYPVIYCLLIPVDRRFFVCSLKGFGRA